MVNRTFAILIFFIIVFVVFLSSGTAADNKVSPSITIDGQMLDISAIIENEYTLVPLRAIFEKFGATVEYNDGSKTIAATKGDLVVTYMIGDNFAYANNRLINLKTLPIVKNGVTYIPLRFVAEAFEANIVWDGSTRTVMIRSPENNVHPSIAEIRKGKVALQHYVSKAMGLPGEKAILHLAVKNKAQAIMLTNISNTDIDLSNWWLKQYQLHEVYAFPIGFVIPAGQNVKISIGHNNGDLNWDKQGVLNEGPNRIDLYNSSNEIVLMFEG